MTIPPTSPHKPNVIVTEAFDLVKRGKKKAAINILRADGYPHPVRDVMLIERFIRICVASAQKQGARHG